jgi:hypothetical protein
MRVKMPTILRLDSAGLAEGECEEIIEAQRGNPFLRVALIQPDVNVRVSLG